MWFDDEMNADLGRAKKKTIKVAKARLYGFMSYLVYFVRKNLQFQS